MELSEPLLRLQSLHSHLVGVGEMTKMPSWCNSLREHLNNAMKDNKDSISYCLATQTSDGPSVRFVVHRGYVNERRASEDESWSSELSAIRRVPAHRAYSENAAKADDGSALEGQVLLSTTDVRYAQPNSSVYCLLTSCTGRPKASRSMSTVRSKLRGG